MTAATSAFICRATDHTTLPLCLTTPLLTVFFLLTLKSSSSNKTMSLRCYVSHYAFRTSSHRQI